MLRLRAVAAVLICAFGVAAAGSARPADGPFAEQRWLYERLDQLPPGALGPSLQPSSLTSGAAELRAPRRESIRRRFRELDSPIRFEYSEPVASMLRVLVVQRRAKSEWMLALQGHYLAEAAAAVAQEELPELLKYLPMAASAWNPAFRDASGRAGLWAFDPATARLYGLRIDEAVDERRHAGRSSAAAARRLKDLRGSFGDWRLALAAHASSPAAVRRAVMKAGGTGGFESARAHLPAAGRALVHAFQACVYLALHHGEENLLPRNIALPDEMERVTVAKAVSIDAAARMLDVPAARLRAWNPHIQGDMLAPSPNEPVDLRVPAGMGQRLGEALQGLEPAQLAETSAPQAVARVATALSYDDLETINVYVVRRGDSLGRIANLYGVTVGQLRQWNGLRGDLIHPGDELSVHAPAPRQRAASPAPPPSGTRRQLHRVRRGETLSGIAGSYGVSVAQLRSWNGLRGDLIYAGQTLSIHLPGPDPTAKPAAAGEGYYTVQKGDTMWGIARRAGVTVSRLKVLNPKVDPRSLRPGTRLRLP